MESDDRLPCPWCDAPLEGETCASCGRAPIVCEHFRVTKVLGRGGMGVVYAGERIDQQKKKKHRHEHDQRVAVKMISPPKDDDWTAWELFERSSKVLQGLHHARLPKVYAFERTDRGRLVLVREPFDGGTLQERLSDADARVEPARVRALLDKMLDLLAYLQGLVPPVIHRDIKPSNIMFRTKDDWEPVLVDFDTIVSRRSGLTIVGTPGYAAPEQFAADASPASDVYGLGATMLFVATHTDADELPHEHGRFVLDHLLPSLDEKLVSVLRKMVEPDVSKRYATARDVAQDLARPVAEPKPVAKTEPKPSPRKEWRAEQVRRRRWPWLIPVGVIALGWALTRRHAHATYPSYMFPSDASAPPPAVVDHSAEEKSCTAGDRVACFSIAWRWDNGEDGVAKDYAKAATYYDRACKLGDANACNNLGVDYEHAYGVTENKKTARDLYDRACTDKYALACRNLALLYEHEDGGAGVPYDLGKSLEYFTRGCDLDDGEACNDLGWLYEEGKAVKQDLKKAASLYALACDHDYLYACRNSAIAYETADGVERDDRRAVALYRKACNDKETVGCLGLGRMTLAGKGTAADAWKASEAFRTGCDDGRLEACEELARLYAAGNGVKKNSAEAKKLYARACDGGVAGSCDELKSVR